MLLKLFIPLGNFFRRKDFLQKWIRPKDSAFLSYLYATDLLKFPYNKTRKPFKVCKKL